MIPPKLIFVLGCNHILQKVAPPCTHRGIVLQVSEYKRELRALSAAYRFNLYCEEINHSVFSIAERHSIDRRKRYINVDMPLDVRSKLCIPLDYSSPFKRDRYGPDQITKWHEVREAYMYERASDRMSPETVSLVICGHEHLERLALRFKALGGKVETATVLDRSWYRPELFDVESELD